MLNKLDQLLEVQKKPIYLGLWDTARNGKSKLPPLLWAVVNHRISTIELLIRAGANPDIVVTGDTGAIHTALHLAIYQAAIPVVKILLKHNANPKILDRFDRTPWLLAMELYDSSEESYNYEYSTANERREHRWRMTQYDKIMDLLPEDEDYDYDAE